MKKKFTFVIAMLLVVALAVPSSAAVFTDVSTDHWAYEAVNKLVAAGIIEGYPDGTFKGDENVSRYEVAIMVDRALERIAEERDSLENEVDSMKDGFSSAQETELRDIVKSIVEKNMPEQKDNEDTKGLNEKEYDQIANLVEALTFNYKAELKNLGSDLKDLENLVDTNKEDVKATIAGLEERVEDLEDPVVSFSGSYDVDMTDQTIEKNAGIIGDEVDYQYNIPSSDGDGDPMTPDGTAYVADYVYTNPWDSDSDTIAADESEGEIAQTLDITMNVTKGDFTSDITLDVAESEDEFEIDSAELELENNFLKVVYNEENTTTIADYAFSEAEFNGITLNAKKYNLDTFFGIKGYDTLPETNNNIATTDEDIEYKVDDNGGKEFIVTKEESVHKFDSDGDKEYDLEEDYYVFGAQKEMSFANVDVTGNYVGQYPLNEDENAGSNNLGFDAATSLDMADLNFDMGYSAPRDDNQDSGMLMRFGATSDLDMATVEFNYKNRDENFSPISEDGAVFDSGDDDYDKFTTGLGLPDMTGYNFKVTSTIMDNIDTEALYSSVTAEHVASGNKAEATKFDVTAEMPLMVDGLTVDGGYTRVNPESDYSFSENTAGNDFEMNSGDETENTISVGAEYEMNDYVKATFDYEAISSSSYVQDDDPNTMSFGVDVEEYSVLGNLTTSAGMDYLTAGGSDATNTDYDETALEYNLGLGYTMGAAEMNYDYSNKSVEGNNLYENTDLYASNDGSARASAEGTYTTHEFGMTYTIVEDTDFEVNHEILNLVDGDDNDLYDIRTTTAGVSISF